MVYCPYTLFQHSVVAFGFGNMLLRIGVVDLDVEFRVFNQLIHNLNKFVVAMNASHLETCSIVDLNN